MLDASWESFEARSADLHADIDSGGIDYLGSAEITFIYFERSEKSIRILRIRIDVKSSTARSWLIATNVPHSTLVRTYVS